VDAASEQQVRKRAYEIWIEHGKVEGRAHDHWIAAERDLKAASTPVKPKLAAARTMVAEIVESKGFESKSTEIKSLETKAVETKGGELKGAEGIEAKPAPRTKGSAAKTAARTRPRVSKTKN